MQKQLVYIVMEKHYNEYPVVVKVFFDLDKAQNLANQLSEKWKTYPDVAYYVDAFIVEE